MLQCILGCKRSPKAVPQDRIKQEASNDQKHTNLRPAKIGGKKSTANGSSKQATMLHTTKYGTRNRQTTQTQTQMQKRYKNTHKMIKSVETMRWESDDEQVQVF